MNPYIIKTVLELISLLILYIIAIRQEKRIAVLEEKEKFPLLSVNNLPSITMLPMDKKPTFKSKVKSEEKRMDKFTFYQDEAYLNGKKIKGYKPKVAKKRVNKK